MNIEKILKCTVLKCKHIARTYTIKHPNTKYSLDLIINEILYVLRSGISWNMYRSKINNKTLYYHFSKFVKHNIFLKAFTKIKNTYLKKYINKFDNCDLIVDSTVIQNKYGINKIGRNKFYKNKKSTKLSLLTDINGFPLSIFFMKGNYHDNSIFEKHIFDIELLLPTKNLRIIADKGYSSKKNYLFLESKNIGHIIPPRRNMKIYDNYLYNKNEYIKRIKVEHIFGRIKNYKRISLRYDKQLRNFSAFVFLSLSIIATNIYNKIIG